jgi:integrase
LPSVRPSEVQAFVRTLDATLSPGTVKGIVGTLTAVYAAAVRDRLVTHNPCDGVKLPAQAKRRVAPLTAEAVELLLEGVGEQYRPLVVLGAGAGLRIGEALGVELRHVDFLRREVRIEQQSTTVRVTSLGPVKTPASLRAVPLGDTVVAELARWLERNPRELGELLVADADGGPIPQNRFSQTWARTVTRVGLPAGTRFHDLRHTYASALISAGCSVVAVQSALGHDSASTTLDIYSHLWPSDHDRTRDAIDAFLRADVSLACHNDELVEQTGRSTTRKG